MLPDTKLKKVEEQFPSHTTSKYFQEERNSKQKVSESRATLICLKGEKKNAVMEGKVQ